MVLNGRKLFVIMLTITGGTFDLECVRNVKMSQVREVKSITSRGRVNSGRGKQLVKIPPPSSLAQNE